LVSLVLRIAGKLNFSKKMYFFHWKVFKCLKLNWLFAQFFNTQICGVTLSHFLTVVEILFNFPIVLQSARKCV
jgi:hypothetical protein